MKDMTMPLEEISPELEDLYYPDEVLTFDGTPEDLVDALFTVSE